MCKTRVKYVSFMSINIYGCLNAYCTSFFSNVDKVNGITFSLKDLQTLLKDPPFQKSTLSL